MVSVDVEVVSPRMPTRPQAGSPGWKLLEQHRKESANLARHIRSTTPNTSRRRHPERQQEKRQSPSRPREQRGEHRIHNNGQRDPRFSYNYREPSQQESNTKRPEAATKRRPQHEIEVPKESDANNQRAQSQVAQGSHPRHYQYSQDHYHTRKDHSHQPDTTSAEKALFTFPWKWRPPGIGEDGPNNNNKTGTGNVGQATAPKPQVRAIPVTSRKPGVRGLPPVADSVESRKDVPSVVFAIHDTGKNGSVVSRESSTPSQLSEPKFGRTLRRHRQPAYPSHKDELPEDRKPIAPSPQAPNMVGNLDDPIPCSESLTGLASNRYVVKGRGTGQIKPANYRRTPKKQTVHDLSELESISTLDLETRYMASEVQNVLENARKAVGRDQIALPKLDSAYMNNNYNTRSKYYAEATSNRATEQQVNPSTRIDGHIVYNLSGPSSKPQSKAKASTSAHTSSISESLEKMKNSLRRKQNMLSHAVLDLKAKQRQEQQDMSYSTGLQRNPDTIPLLQNQNYISHIFTDIKSKMTTKHQTHNGSPYIPKVGGILHSKKEQDRENTGDRPMKMSMGWRGDGQARLQEEAQPNYHPQPTGPTSEYFKYRHPSRCIPNRHDVPIGHEEITSVHIQDPCSITSPITEQFSTLLSPPPQSHSSLYLPNIRSRRNTPVPDTQLPFRPSAAIASPAPHIRASEPRRKHQPTQHLVGRAAESRPRHPSEIARGGGHHYQPPHTNAKGNGTSSVFRLPSIQDIIDVTSQASPFRFIEDLTNSGDQASKDPERSAPSSKDVIDVTSLASSRLSKTTIKSVTCVDEDSQGVIRSTRKLAQMPKRFSSRRQQERIRRGYRGPDKSGPSKPEPMGYLAAEDALVATYPTIGEDEEEDETEEELHRQTGDQKGEEEIVFAKGSDAKKGLFEGIWDDNVADEFEYYPRGPPNNRKTIVAPRSSREASDYSPKDAPNVPPWSSRESSRDDELPKNRKPIIPPRSSGGRNSSDASNDKNMNPTPAELKGPVFMTPRSKEKRESRGRELPEKTSSPKSQNSQDKRRDKRSNTSKNSTAKKQQQPPDGNDQMKN